MYYTKRLKKKEKKSTGHINESYFSYVKTRKFWPATCLQKPI